MRRVVVVRIGMAVGELGHAAAAGQFRRQLAVLDAFEVGEDRLLDQPVGRAFEARRSVFQPLAEQIVDFDAKGGACHGGFVRRCEAGQ